jgi:hypothetical protein
VVTVATAAVTAQEGEKGDSTPDHNNNNLQTLVAEEKENVRLVDCGRVHRQALDNLTSTIHMIYFKEGGRFYGRSCSRCSIDLLEFFKRRAPPMFTKEVFFCTYKTCPYMLCSKCNGMVLLHGT